MSKAPCLLCELLEPKYKGLRYLIYDGKYWQLEHTALPTKVKGWLRLVIKRHIVALHEITEKEFNELRKLLPAAAATLHRMLKTDKEYVMSFAEGAGTRHLHIHVVAKQKNLPEEVLGAKIFAWLNVPPQKGLSPKKIKEFTKQFKPRFIRQLKKK